MKERISCSTMSFRAVVRESYFHQSDQRGEGGGAYGLSFSAHHSDSLDRGQHIIYLHEQAAHHAGTRRRQSSPTLYRQCLDQRGREAPDDLDMGHASFPYMELVEGKLAAQIATETVWRQLGWMTALPHITPPPSSQRNRCQRDLPNRRHRLRGQVGATERGRNVVGSPASTSLPRSPRTAGSDQKTRLPPRPWAQRRSRYRTTSGTYENPLLRERRSPALPPRTTTTSPARSPGLLTNTITTLPDTLYLSSKPASRRKSMAWWTLGRSPPKTLHTSRRKPGGNGQAEP